MGGCDDGADVDDAKMMMPIRGGGVGASVGRGGDGSGGVWVVVVGRAREGEWYSGSYRSDDEEKIWDLAGKTHRKTFPATADGGRRWGSGGCRKWGREK
ncbi:hypothetical protein Tco_1075088 [Tanacetum coccineum]